jgi:hypothetical protein
MNPYSLLAVDSKTESQVNSSEIREIDSINGTNNADILNVEKQDRTVISENVIQNVVTNSEHERLGHFGTPPLPCNTCIQCKRRKRNIRKKANAPKDLLDVVEIDIQGPFPHADSEGNFMNVKLVDHQSGYVKCEMITTKNSSTMCDIFRRYQARMERRTGKSIKYVRTDSGTEFDGDFLKYVESQGIIKQKGLPYEHHIPSECERMHQTLLGSARAMLHDSKLPQKYYGDAIQVAAYTWNRIGSPSPFELIFGKRPKLDHIVKFGTIGYAYIPSERRSKLEDVVA